MSERQKVFQPKHAIAVTCAAILVGTEIIAAALALGWALGGLLGWGETARLGLIGASLILGVYLTYLFVMRALQAEPVYL